MKNRQVSMTFAQAAELNPAIKTQIREGLSDTKPGFKVIEINQAQPSAEEMSDEEDTRKASAIATCTIESIPFEAIIDSGAGGCIIAKKALDRLGWGIELPTSLNFTTSGGNRAVPLGKMKDIPIRFGDITIPVTMLVVDTQTYDVILGNEWLDKARAVINIFGERIRITCRGRTLQIPINIQKGARPETEDVTHQPDQVMVAQPGSSHDIDFEDTDDEEKAQHGWRLLYKKERNYLIDWNIRYRYYPFCEQRIYCAEMMCDCPQTKRIPKEDTLQEHMPTNPRIHNRPPQPKKQEMPNLQQGPYSGKQPHPFRDGSRIWDICREKAPFIGKAHFFGNRDDFQNKYWDEWNVRDMWIVAKRSEYPDQHFDHKYHGTYLEDWDNEHHREHNEDMINVMINARRTNYELPLPQHATEGSAGLDLMTPESISLQPGDSTILDTGFALEIPEGHFGMVKPRSSLAKAGLTTDAGVIDQDYTGTIRVIVVNRHRTNQIDLEKGDRVAQMIILPYATVTLREQHPNLVRTTARGQGRFGSTGVNAAIVNRQQISVNRKEEGKNDRLAVKIGRDLQEGQIMEIKVIINRNQDIFVTSLESTTGADPKYQHHIDTGDHEPIKKAPYCLNPSYRKWVTEEITRL